MKKINGYYFLLVLVVAVSSAGCYKLQKDYEYKKSEIDPHYNMTVKEFINLRGKAGVGSDTALKWMQLGIEYAGIDWAEYEKPGRTYILLHTDGIRTLTSGRTTAGFFFDYPVVVKDATGNVIKSKIDPTLDSLRPALTWNEYPKEFVKNYFLYLIVQGEYGFDNLGVNNTTVQTLLPAGATALPKETKLSWVLTKNTPNPDPTSATTIVLVNNGSGASGFDPEGKMNLKLGNNDQSPIVVNDRTNDRTAGYYFTNGRAHVFPNTNSSSRSVVPFRYSWQ